MKYLFFFLFLIGCYNQQPKVPKQHSHHITIMPIMSDVELEEMKNKNKNKNKEFDEMLKVYN